MYSNAISTIRVILSTQKENPDVQKCYCSCEYDKQDCHHSTETRSRSRVCRGRGCQGLQRFADLFQILDVVLLNESLVAAGAEVVTNMNRIVTVHHYQEQVEVFLLDRVDGAQNIPVDFLSARRGCDRTGLDPPASGVQVVEQVALQDLGRL
jgi:hypothetical protein